MSMISHPPAEVVRERRGWARQLLVPEMWASLSIVAMWLAVLIDAVWGPSIVSETPGGTSTSVPSAVVVALFAFLATWPVAKYGFVHERRDSE